MSNLKDQKKLVSVLIPVFNVEEYVEEAIQSIMDQTCKNLEIIVVDDASTDGTYDAVKKLAIKDERIKLFRNEKNLKIAGTLNRALSKANGYYIARMDGDDISAPGRIEKKVKFLELNPQFDLVGCSIKTMNENGEIVGKADYYADEEFLKATLKYRTPVNHFWVTKKSVYEKLGGYREMAGIEDYDFLLRLTTAGVRYTNLQKYYGYYFRIGRPGNTASRIGIKQRKMKKYAFKLYEERKKKGVDSFSTGRYNKVIQSNPFAEKVDLLSGKFLFYAVQAKGKKQNIRAKLFLLLSLISPHQLSQLYMNIRFKSLLKQYLRSISK